jgi:hypothetical protein
MYILLANAAADAWRQGSAARRGREGREVRGRAHPEFAFDLGSTYATMDPPQKEKAVRFLNTFTKRVCRGARREEVPGAVRDILVVAPEARAVTELLRGLCERRSAVQRPGARVFQRGRMLRAVVEFRQVTEAAWI